MLKKREMTIVKWAIVVLSLAVAGVSLAAATGGSYATVGTVAGNVQGTFGALSKLISAAAFIAGLVFVGVSLLTFKGHKDQPTQVPLSKAIVQLTVGAALLFLVSVIGVGGGTLFGGSAATAGTSGISTL